MWLAMAIVCAAVVVLAVGTVVTAWRIAHRPPAPGPPPSPEDSEHSWADHGSAGVFREHLG